MANVNQILPQRRASRRRGMAVVEAALIFPLLLLITFGVIEYGWMFLKHQQVTNAARQAARTAAVPDATNGKVTTLVTNLMTAAGMGNSQYQLTFTPNDVASVTPGNTVTVSVSVPYGNIDISGVTLIPQPTNISATVTMAKEGP